MSTPFLIATAGRRIARCVPAAILMLIGCAGCSGDDLPAPPPSAWAHRGDVHVALADRVTMGAVVIDRVQFEGSTGDEIQQDPVAIHAVWVELVNPGNEAVRLAGFGLSDQKVLPFKWVFPAGAVLAAGGRLRVSLTTASDAAATVRVTAPNGTAAGVLLDSTQALRPTARAAWCRQMGGASGARFAPCAVLEASSTSRGRHQDLAGLAITPAGPQRSRE